MRIHVFFPDRKSVLTTVVAFIALICVEPQTAYGQIHITGVNPVDTPADAGCFEVPFQTSWEDAVKELPTTATITLSDASEKSVSLTWSPTYLYFPYCFGDHEVVGTFELPQGVEQADPPIPLQISRFHSLKTLPLSPRLSMK